jgi:hypothetical protein
VGEQPLDVLGQDVDLEVDPVSGLLDAEGGQLQRGGDEADGEVGVAGLDDGEADAVDGDGALLHDVLGELLREPDPHRPALGPLFDGAGAVDMALDEVPVEPAAQLHGALQVDAGAGGQCAEAGAGEGLADDVGRELALRGLHDGEADAVHGDRVAVPHPLGDDGAPQAEAGGARQFLYGDDFAELFDDSGEHSGLLGGSGGSGGGS